MGEMFFWEFFLGILWDEIFGRNSSFTLLKSAKLLKYERIDLYVKILIFVKILSQSRKEGRKEDI